MRRTFLTTLAFLPAAAFAGDLLGTKADPAGSSNGPSTSLGLAPMLQMLLALGIVLVLLKVLLPKLLTKFGKKLVTKLDGGIKIEESANFPGGTLYVVKARKKTLLVSVASSGVTCLTDLTEPDPLENQPTFQELVEQVDTPETFAVVEQPVDQTATHRALERLRRLTG